MGYHSWLVKEPETDAIIRTDACLVEYGGIHGTEYFRGRFPIADRNRNIATLEMWAVMVALKIWGEKLSGKYFWIHVDNEAVAMVLNTGSSRDQELQNVLREIALLAARHQFIIKARCIPGIENRIPDWLSRWHEPIARWEFRKFVRDSSIKHIKTSCELLKYTHDW